VLQGGHDLRFPLKALEKLRCVDQMWFDNLNGNLTLGLNLACPVDPGHPTFTQESYNLVLTQALTDPVCHTADDLAVRFNPSAGGARRNAANELSMITSCSL
jgi:hypothetical protein